MLDVYVLGNIIEKGDLWFATRDKLYARLEECNKEFILRLGVIKDGKERCFRKATIKNTGNVPFYGARHILGDEIADRAISYLEEFNGGFCSTHKFFRTMLLIMGADSPLNIEECEIHGIALGMSDEAADFIHEEEIIAGVLDGKELDL